MRKRHNWSSNKYLDVNFVGIDFHTLTKIMGIGAYNSVEAAAAYVLKKSKELVPIDQGDLQASGKRKMAIGKAMGRSYGSGNMTSFGAPKKGTFAAPVVYGGMGLERDVKYARVQHERNYVHRNGRVRKYLFKALKECKDKNVLGMNVKQRWAAIAALKGR